MADAKKPKANVSKKKIEDVKKLAEDMKNAKTIMIVSIKNLPSPQYQKIKKDLRGKANVKVAKKSKLLRAIDETKIPEMASLKEHIKADCALALSEEDAFELAAWLTENRNPINAKQGQIAEEDIEVEPGPTDLVPGPDISALGAVGLKVAVEDGKIAVKEPHIILKKGEEVTENIASVLQKLNIKPFMVGISPSVIYDSVDKKIYSNIKIDKEEAKQELLSSHSKAVGFAQKIVYYCKEVIGYLLAKANSEAGALEKLSPKEEEKVEEKKEEPKETEEKPVEEDNKEKAENEDKPDDKVEEKKEEVQQNNPEEEQK